MRHTILFHFRSLRTSLMVLGVALAMLVTLALPRLAHAKGEPKAIVVYAEGPDSKDLRLDAVKVIPAEFSVGNTDAFLKALAKEGHKGNMQKPFDKPKDREKLVSQIRKAAKASGLEAVVILLSSKDKKGNRSVRIILVETKSTSPFFDKEIPLEKKKKGGDDQEALRDALKSPLDNMLPPEPEKKDDDKKETAAASKEGKDGKDGNGKDEGEKPPEPKEGERPVNEVARAILVLNAGIEIAARRFDYNDRGPVVAGKPSGLRAYDVTGAPMFVLAGELYPLAGTSTPVIKDFGLVGNFARAFALKSAPQAGTPIDTAWSRYQIGARERIRISGDNGPIVGLSLIYGTETFAFSANGPIAEEVPAVNYKFIRLGVDGRVPIGVGAVFLGFGYDIVQAGTKCTQPCTPASTENVADRFPNSKVGGIDLTVGAAYNVTKGLEARLSVLYRRFFYTMNPDPGDRFVAGGAVDNLTGIQLGAAYAY